MAKSDGKAIQSVFLPGPESWEWWKGSVQQGMECAEKTGMTGVAPEKIPAGAGFVFPVSAAYAVPFWSATDDPALIEDVGGIQLEKLALNPEEGLGRLRDFLIVDRIGHRTLVVGTVLAQPEGLHFSKNPPPDFHVSPFLYALANDSATVWRELGRLVLTITRTDAPVYFHALSSRELDEAAIREIKCIVLQLQTQGIIEDIDEMVVWLGRDAGGGIAKVVDKELGVRTRFADQPGPRLPESASELVPEEVAWIRRKRESRRKLKNQVTIGALVYLAVVGVFAGRYFLTKQKAARLQAEIAAVEPEADDVRAAQVRWDLLRDSLDADVYPHELLYKCVQILPPQGVQLTEFQASSNSVYLTGNASRYEMAIGLKNDIEKAPMLADYRWEFDKPSLTEMGGASFFVKGTRKDAATQEK